MLIIETEQTLTTYFYSPAYRVGMVPYQKHNLGHWNSYLLLTKGALPLKYSIDNGIFTWVAEAIKVEELDLKISEFESPDFIRFSN